MTDNSTLIFDDDIDEQFNEKTQEKVIDLPTPLSNDELAKLHSLLQSKSNKDLLQCITNVMQENNKSVDAFQRAQIDTAIAKTHANMSKFALIETLTKIVNVKNKHIVFGDDVKLSTMTTQQKPSREELLKKLHNKKKMANKNTMQQMYEKLQEELANANLDENGDDLTGDQVLQKKKKNKKLDPKKLQNKLMAQMTNAVKNAGGFSGTPTSA